MNALAFEDDDFFEDDEDFDDAALEGLGESDDLDDFLERRRRGRGRSRRIRRPATGKGSGLFKPRPSNQYVTQAQLQAGLARVGKQIQTNGTAIKKVAEQANRINSELGSRTDKLAKGVGELKKEVKRQAEMSLLMTLLQSTPQLEAKNPTAETGTAGAVVTNVQVKKQSNILPLLLMLGGGGLGGGDSSQTLLLGLALSGQL